LTIKVEDFETIPLSCDPDTFLETLLINIKNETISHQSYMRKAKLKKLKDLENQIITLKKTPVNNTDEILRKEKELNLLRDFEMRSELERFRHFDILNNEKMSPRFIALSKIKANSDPLDKVCKADGSAFATALERQEYINNFYQSIYTPDPANQVLSPTVIEDFLGPVICESDVVKKSKLTQDEMLHFDRPITLQELDHATYSLNEKSAGGLDGIGAKFFKKFWFLLRQPMLKYVTHCFNTGNLTQSFSSAGIKLIPKKGDTRQIKNWRPISLLNCVFKIIAKTVDTRLQKINEIILTRAQKGFTKNRQIQECIINIVETIAYSEKNKVPGFILALDMAKAFDTVRHDFMTKVYQFYGLGPNMIKAMCTITTNRSAAIILDDGSTATPFRLGSGFLQGSPPSPNEFNICEQILILKLDLDPAIKKINPFFSKRSFSTALNCN
jgi:hypothetical protein